MADITDSAYMKEELKYLRDFRRYEEEHEQLDLDVIPAPPMFNGGNRLGGDLISLASKLADMSMVLNANYKFQLKDWSNKASDQIKRQAQIASKYNFKSDSVTGVPGVKPVSTKKSKEKGGVSFSDAVKIQDLARGAGAVAADFIFNAGTSDEKDDIQVDENKNKIIENGKGFNLKDYLDVNSGVDGEVFKYNIYLVVEIPYNPNVDHNFDNCYSIGPGTDTNFKDINECKDYIEQLSSDVVLDDVSDDYFKYTKASVIVNKLNKIADCLEDIGMYKEASSIDRMIKEAGVWSALKEINIGPHNRRLWTIDSARKWSSRISAWQSYFNNVINVLTNMQKINRKYSSFLSNLIKIIKNIADGFKNKLGSSSAFGARLNKSIELFRGKGGLLDSFRTPMSGGGKMILR